MNTEHKTLSQKVFEYVHFHPGCTRAEILETLPPNNTPGSVSGILRRLERDNAIENRGGNTCTAAWYPVETQVNGVHLGIANELLEELKDIHNVVRPLYLARRLEEIFGDLT